MRLWRVVPRLGRRRSFYIFSVLGTLTLVYTILQFTMLWNVSLQSQSQIHNSIHQLLPITASPTDTSIKHTPKEPMLKVNTPDIEDDFPEVPVYLVENPKYRPSNRSKHKHYLTVRHEGGLGNHMFAYASLRGISHRNYMIPLWPGFQLLRNYFHLGATEMTEATSSRSWSLFLEDGANLYDDRTEQLNYDLDILLLGFYQSWKYFAKQKHVIKQHFRFRKEILGLGMGYLQQAYEERYGLKNTSASSVTFVGIHIRRGDMLHQHNVKRGYTVATAEYIETAMIFFASRHQNVLFVVCSDDMPWSIKHVPRNIAPVAFSAEHYDIEDLAILSLCNHTIMTVGTFGWWAAWLAGGTVLYYADFPARNSELESEFDPKDTYPPDWKGISFRVKRS